MCFRQSLTVALNSRTVGDAGPIELRCVIERDNVSPASSSPVSSGMATRIRLILLAAICALGLVVWVASENGPVSLAANANISFTCCAYAPAAVTVQVGETVTWTPDAGSSFSQHPLRIDALGIQKNDGTDPFTLPFTSAGTFTYYCAIHVAQGMFGTITVDAAPPSPTATPSPGGTPKVYVPYVQVNNPAPTATPTVTNTPTVTPTPTQTNTPTVTPTFPPFPTNTPGGNPFNPGPPSQFFAAGRGTRIDVTWTNPGAINLSGYRIANCHDFGPNIQPQCNFSDAYIPPSFISTLPNQSVLWQDFNVMPLTYDCYWIQYINFWGQVSQFYPNDGFNPIKTIGNCAIP